jgi:hypothetical protein
MNNNEQCGRNYKFMKENNEIIEAVREIIAATCLVTKKKDESDDLVSEIELTVGDADAERELGSKREEAETLLASARAEVWRKQFDLKRIVTAGKRSNPVVMEYSLQSN